MEGEGAPRGAAPVIGVGRERPPLGSGGGVGYGGSGRQADDRLIPQLFEALGGYDYILSDLSLRALTEQ